MILVLLALDCGFAAARATPEPLSTAVLDLTEIQADRPTVLVLRKSTANMDTFVRGLVGELDPDFNVAALVVGKDTTVEVIARAMAERAPDALVVLDNPTAELYRQYQEAYADRKYPPAIIGMALFVEQTTARIRNATGIAYEVPAVTSFGRLRSTVRSEVVKVGVIHRPPFAEFVEAQAQLASIEGFEIVPYEVAQKPGVGQVRKGLIALDKLDVDALWVLNDNVLLTPEVLVGAWLPLMRRNERPVVVGVSSLLRTDPPVGSFAVLPDHESLGMQAAELIYELHDADWAISASPPQLPIAVETVLNRPLIERTVGLQEGAIDQVDQILD